MNESEFNAMTTASPIIWDSAPVQTQFGNMNIEFDGVATYRGTEYRVNVIATRGARKPEITLRHMTPAKRGHLVPETALADLRAQLTTAALVHLKPLRAEIVSKAQGLAPADDMAGMTLAMAGLAPEAAGLALDVLDHPPAPLRDDKPGVIDCTPTWQGMLPMLLMLLENGDAKGRQMAREEMERMAALAGRYVDARAALARVAGGRS